jgi:acyl-CoA thioester hydrolase
LGTFRREEALRCPVYGGFRVKIRVYYEDTDAGGIVYHTNYIKYCERARSEHFFSRGIIPGEGERNGFVVRTLKADYLATATLGDLLEVTTEVMQTKHSSTTLLHEISKENEVIFRMEIVLVYLEEGKPARIPTRFKEVFGLL